MYPEGPSLLSTESVSPKDTQASVQFSSVAQSCPTLCNPMNHSMPGLPIHHQLPELKLNIQKRKIMASGPITSCEIHGETLETVSDFIFLVSKITADGDCSHEIKRRLLLGRKVMSLLFNMLFSWS